MKEHLSLLLAAAIVLFVGSIVGGYIFGKRLPQVGLPLAAISLYWANYLFFEWSLTSGEGASIGVVIFYVIYKGAAIVLSIFSLSVVIGFVARVSREKNTDEVRETLKEGRNPDSALDS